MIEIDRDLRDIVMSAVRYALGRRTTMPSATTEYIMKHRELVDNRVKQVLLRDLEYYFDKWECGLQTDDRCDYDTWLLFKKWLEQLEVEDENFLQILFLSAGRPWELAQCHLCQLWLRYLCVWPGEALFRIPADSG